MKFDYISGQPQATLLHKEEMSPFKIHRKF